MDFEKDDLVVLRDGCFHPQMDNGVYYVVVRVTSQKVQVYAYGKKRYHYRTLYVKKDLIQNAIIT